ncbi:MAG: hypothetical protein AAB316_21795 [Bacteroidota bacterium]
MKPTFTKLSKFSKRQASDRQSIENQAARTSRMLAAKRKKTTKFEMRRVQRILEKASWEELKK